MASALDHETQHRPTGAYRLLANDNDKLNNPFLPFPHLPDQGGYRNYLQQTYNRKREQAHVQIRLAESYIFTPGKPKREGAASKEAGGQSDPPSQLKAAIRSMLRRHGAQTVETRKPMPPDKKEPKLVRMLFQRWLVSVTPQPTPGSRTNKYPVSHSILEPAFA